MLQFCNFETMPRIEGKMPETYEPVNFRRRAFLRWGLMAAPFLFLGGLTGCRDFQADCLRPGMDEDSKLRLMEERRKLWERLPIHSEIQKLADCTGYSRDPFEVLLNAALVNKVQLDILIGYGMVESSLRCDARARGTTAGGPYQITDSTRMLWVKKYITPENRDKWERFVDPRVANLFMSEDRNGIRDYAESDTSKFDLPLSVFLSSSFLREMVVRYGSDVRTHEYAWYWAWMSYYWGEGGTKNVIRYLKNAGYQDLNPALIMENEVYQDYVNAGFTLPGRGIDDDSTRLKLSRLHFQRLVTVISGDALEYIKLRLPFTPHYRELSDAYTKLLEQTYGDNQEAYREAISIGQSGC